MQQEHDAADTGEQSECRDVQLQSSPFVVLKCYRKGVGTCDALLCLSHILQSALESGQGARIVQILASVQPLIESTIWAFSI